MGGEGEREVEWRRRDRVTMRWKDDDMERKDEEMEQKMRLCVMLNCTEAVCCVTYS